MYLWLNMCNNTLLVMNPHRPDSSKLFLGCRFISFRKQVSSSQEKWVQARSARQTLPQSSSLTFLISSMLLPIKLQSLAHLTSPLLSDCQSSRYRNELPDLRSLTWSSDDESITKAEAMAIKRMHMKPFFMFDVLFLCQIQT